MGYGWYSGQDPYVLKTNLILVIDQFLLGKYDFEISHHYGLDKFNKFGLVMITVLNRDYCKKILVLFPGQKHPEQWHNVKEETFHILFGKINLKDYIRQFIDKS